MDRKTARQILADWIASYPSPIPEGLSIAAALSLVEHAMTAAATKALEPGGMVFGPSGMRQPRADELEAMRVVLAGQRLASEIQETAPAAAKRRQSVAAGVLALLNGNHPGAERRNEKREHELVVRRIPRQSRALTGPSGAACECKGVSAAAKFVGVSRHALARAIKKAGLKPGDKAMARSGAAHAPAKIATFTV